MKVTPHWDLVMHYESFKNYAGVEAGDIAEETVIDSLQEH